MHAISEAEISPLCSISTVVAVGLHRLLSNLKSMRKHDN